MFHSRVGCGDWPMPIQRLLEINAFGPEEIAILTTAFEDALRSLCLVDRTDPVTQMVAKKLIELAQQGERDPIRLREGILKSFAK
jgi:hypothetical protein